jgi:hypothetical protein
MAWITHTPNPPTAVDGQTVTHAIGLLPAQVAVPTEVSVHAHLCVLRPGDHIADSSGVRLTRRDVRKRFVVNGNNWPGTGSHEWQLSDHPTWLSAVGRPIRAPVSRRAARS